MRALPIVLAVAVLAVAGCGDDDEPAEPTATAGASATPTNTATLTPTATATATAEGAPEVLWPNPSVIDAVDPVEVARSFVTDFIKLDDPALSEFRLAEPNAGEVDVFRRGEDGSQLDKVIATIQLRKGEGGNWSVTTVGSEEVQIDSPAPYEEVRSPLTVSGKGRGFEGNIVLEVRAAYATEALDQQPIIAGSMAELEPFEETLRFRAEPGSYGAVVAKTGSGIAAVDGFTAFPVAF
jgi:Immunoglobulin-like domain of bacterial spore germination